MLSNSVFSVSSKILSISFITNEVFSPIMKVPCVISAISVKTFLLSLGIAFLVSGVIFFFAYNWASLHKFIKLGLLQALIITMVCVAVFLNVIKM